MNTVCSTQRATSVVEPSGYVRLGWVSLLGNPVVVAAAEPALAGFVQDANAAYYRGEY
jgi:hypothetical protein